MASEASGEMLPSSIDPEAHWTKSGWHALALLREVPVEARCILGDRHSNTPRSA